MAETTLKAGMLISLYNLYAGYFESATVQSPEILGMYLKTDREGQFEYYEVAVLKDESGRGGFVQRYLTSDFVIMPIADEERKAKLIGVNIGEDN